MPTPTRFTKPKPPHETRSELLNELVNLAHSRCLDRESLEIFVRDLASAYTNIDLKAMLSYMETGELNDGQVY